MPHLRKIIGEVRNYTLCRGIGMLKLWMFGFQFDKTICKPVILVI